MFGYININQKELSEESKKIYQAYYCGLCQKLKTNCGTKGQMLLSYDLTFLIVLLTGLYELENTETEFTCPLHPTKKRTAYINEATEYAADMNLILAYQNLLDDWKDEKSYTKKAFVKILDKDYTYRVKISKTGKGFGRIHAQDSGSREEQRDESRSCGRSYR